MSRADPLPAFQRKLRFGDAAHAIEATPKTLRNWLQRDQVQLGFGAGHAAAQASGWREFMLADIAVLAIVRRLVDFGMTVERASSAANEALSGVASRLLTFKNPPPAALIAGFLPVVLVAWRNPPGGDWHTDIRRRDASFLPAAAVVIDVAAVLSVAFRRAAEGEGSE